MHEPLPRRTAVQADVTLAHVLHRDIETRSTVDLKKVGAAKYAADPSTEVLCVAYAVDDGPVQLWLPRRSGAAGIHRSCGGSELGCVCAQRRFRNRH